MYPDEKAGAPDHRAGEPSSWILTQERGFPSSCIFFSITTVRLLKPLNSASSKHSFPWVLVGGAGHCQDHPAASVSRTPSLKSVILRDILSSLPHMAAPSAPSPGDWAEKEVLSLCQKAENCRSQDLCPHRTAPHLFPFSRVQGFICSATSLLADCCSSLHI